MEKNRFTRLLEDAPCMLGEGAVIERLRRDSGFELDPLLVNSAFIYGRRQRAALEGMYVQYLEIGRDHDLPLFLSTPTWRASRERIEEAGYADYDVNGDNARFMEGLRRRFGDYGEKVIVSGLMSCRGDAYRPDETLSATAAQDFHAWQAERLAASEVDVLLAATLPALSEALGLARAMAATGRPYLVSFIARPAGTLLDGTPLAEAVATIDAGADPAPVAYLFNCTHASFARDALGTMPGPARRRIVGLLANTAALSPEELNNSDKLVEQPPEAFGSAVAALHRSFGLKLLGGCCGTDERHIRALAERLVAAGE
jgi:homocysteine S-methyltransferase